MTTPAPSWETVLHGVESDVLRTEALLTSAITERPDELWPGHDVDLPALDAMPELSEALIERVHALRLRLAQVRTELELAMRANRALLAETISDRPVTQDRAPRFFDTLV